MLREAFKVAACEAEAWLASEEIVHACHADADGESSRLLALVDCVKLLSPLYRHHADCTAEYRLCEDQVRRLEAPGAIPPKEMMRHVNRVQAATNILHNTHGNCRSVRTKPINF